MNGILCVGIFMSALYLLYRVLVVIMYGLPEGRPYSFLDIAGV